MEFSPSSQSSDTDTFIRVSEASPIQDLQLIAPLILDADQREHYIARLDGPQAGVATEIFQVAGQLTLMTEWREELLLEKLGCVTKTIDAFDGVDLEGLENCLKFLRLAARNAGLVSTAPDRRRVVISTAKLLKAVGGSIDRLASLMETDDLGYMPVDLLRMGEISAAAAKVRSLAGVEREGERRGESDPFADAPTVHLSPTRVRMLIEGRRDLLGEDVANYMELHIADCPACREALEYRKARLTEV